MAALGQTPEGVLDGPERAEVLGAAEPLLQKAEQLGAGLARRDEARHGHVAQSIEHGERHQREHAHRRADRRRDAEEERQHRDEEERVPDDLHDEAREEAGEARDVAVDPLDQLAWRPSVVEAEVEREAVAREVCAHLVRRGLAEVLGDVGLGDGDDLPGDRRGEEQESQLAESLDSRSTCGRVDEDAEELRDCSLTAMLAASSRASAATSATPDRGTIAEGRDSRARAYGLIRYRCSPGKSSIL